MRHGLNEARRQGNSTFGSDEPARRKRMPIVFEVRQMWPQVPIAMGDLKNPLCRRCGWPL
jgi:hypothetical protein